MMHRVAKVAVGVASTGGLPMLQQLHRQRFCIDRSFLIVSITIVVVNSKELIFPQFLMPL